MAIYSDGHEHCHICKHHTHTSNPEEAPRIKTKKPSKLIDAADITIEAISKRGLDEETCRHWRYGVASYKGEPVQVAQYCTDDGVVVGQKIRTREKDFRFLGDAAAAGLYGQHLWRDKGKQVIITEGEIDAMSVSQVQQHKWPVVSIPTGASGAAKAVLKSLDWLEGFERVVFMFDMDEPGRKAAAECAALLTPGKAFIASLPMKDANEMLVARKGADIINAAWGAKAFRPDGIVAGTDIWEKIVDTKTFESLEYPWPGLNTITRGIRPGELVTVAAGTGIGKSEVVRQIAAHLHDKQDETIGYIALEESVQRTALGFMGLHLGRRLHVDPGDLARPEVRSAYEATIGSGRYYLYDHWGSLDGDHLITRIRFMARSLGCKTIVLDHISIVVAGTETNDERKTIDVFMTKLRSLIEELQFRCIIITHLRKGDGKSASHEEGGRVRLQDFRGTGSIAQYTNIAIGLERNQQDKINGHLTRLRILKNRYTGETGEACWLKFDQETGRLEQTAGPKVDDADDEQTTAEGCPF